MVLFWRLPYRFASCHCIIMCHEWRDLVFRISFFQEYGKSVCGYYLNCQRKIEMSPSLRKIKMSPCGTETYA